MVWGRIGIVVVFGMVWESKEDICEGKNGSIGVFIGEVRYSSGREVEIDI